MKILRSTCLAITLIAGTVSTAAAQDAMSDKLKDKATNIAVDKAKDAVDNSIADKAIDMGADMANGASVKDAGKDAVMNAATSKAKGMATERMPGGGTIKTRAPNSAVPTAIMNDGKVIVHNDGSASVAGEGTIVMEAPQPVLGQPMTAPTSQPVPLSSPISNGTPKNCPSGTTGQPDGTCMITGNYLG